MSPVNGISVTPRICQLISLQPGVLSGPTITESSGTVSPASNHDAAGPACSIRNRKSLIGGLR